MTVQHKFVSFAEFKAKTDGPGGWEGYLSKTGEIDDGGDLIVQGAYADTIPDFLQRGFNAESHDWRFSTMIGFPTSAKEDEQGLFVASQYHSTPDAQLVRQKAKERMDAGLGVYMSIGYEVMPADTERIDPDQYGDIIPKYSRKGLSEQNLLKALQFPFIRLIKKVNLFEGSIVSVPMLRSAEVTAVKSLPGGLGTDLSYSEHARWLVTANSEFVDRTEVREEMRTKEGRVLSSANWSEIDDIISVQENALSRLKTIRDNHKPKPKEDEEQKSQSFDIQQVMNGLMVLDLQLQGVPIR